MSADSFLQGLTSPFYKVKSEAERYAEKVVKTSLVKDDCGPFQSYSVYIYLGPAVDKNVEVEARRVSAELYDRFVVLESFLTKATVEDLAAKLEEVAYSSDESGFTGLANRMVESYREEDVSLKL